MKIAILISGHLRSYKKTIENFNKFKDSLVDLDHDVKVFCHTWDKFDSDTQTWWRDITVLNVEAQKIKQELIGLYNPAKHLVDSAKNYSVFKADKLQEYKSDIAFEGIQFMYLSLKRSWDLYTEFEESSGFIADLIIRTRYDLLVEPLKRIDINFYVPLSVTYGLIGGVSDIFAVIPRRFGAVYFNMIEHIYNNKIYSSYCDNYRYYAPEIFLSFILEYFNVKYDYVINKIEILRQSNEKIAINHYTCTPFDRNYYYSLGLLKAHPLNVSLMIRNYFYTKVPLMIDLKPEIAYDLYVRALTLELTIKDFIFLVIFRDKIAKRNIKYALPHYKKNIKSIVIRALTYLM